MGSDYEVITSDGAPLNEELQNIAQRVCRKSHRKKRKVPRNMGLLFLVFCVPFAVFVPTPYMWGRWLLALGVPLFFWGAWSLATRHFFSQEAF